MLVDHQIQRLYAKGEIVIDLFNIDQLNPNSYDVTLGNWFCIQKQHTDPAKWIFELGKSDWSDLWHPPTRLDSYVIAPGETILAHTEERIGGRFRIGTEMRAKSTVGRSGIEVCKCAGHGDVGYISKWTMEITNNVKISIRLTPGQRIAQIVFFATEVPSNPYAGRYGQGLWTPEDMLPKPSGEAVLND